MQQTESATHSGAEGQVQAFEYPSDPGAHCLPVSELWSTEGDGVEAGAVQGSRSAGTQRAKQGVLGSELEKQLAEESRKSFEAGRERGRQEGRQAEREAQSAIQKAAEERRMRQAAELIDSLAQERDRYLRTVEHEVVKLALAVAARILRREAQMDPLLLTGAVRVALGQLASSTQVRLRVPEADLDLWTEAMALLPNLAIKPVVIAGEGMRLGDCAVETGLGTVDLGIRAQLGEIERGFFDRAVAVCAEPAVQAEQALSAGREAGR